jgi:hypothetical protein
MKDDYGYFGKGIDGYVHYQQFMTQDRQMLNTANFRRGRSYLDSSSILKKPWFWIVIALLGVFSGICRSL